MKAYAFAVNNNVQRAVVVNWRCGRLSLRYPSLGDTSAARGAEVGQRPTNESQCSHWPSVASTAFTAGMAENCSAGLPFPASACTVFILH